MHGISENNTPDTLRARETRTPHNNMKIYKATLQSNITTNLTNAQTGVKIQHGHIYAYTLQSNITSDVKKKRRGSKRRILPFLFLMRGKHKPGLKTD